MKKATMYYSILFLILVINTFSILDTPQFSQYSIIKGNPLSADNITSANVTIDRTILKRGIESVKITFNNSAGLDWPFYKAKIDLPDENHVNITLMNSSAAPTIYSGVFTPSITNMTGFANITVLAVDLNGVIQNEGTVSRDYIIQIVNNLPYVGVRMNATEIYRGDAVMLNFTPSDVEQAVVDLKWRAALYRKGNPDVLITTFVNWTPTFGYVYTVPLSIVIGDYFINATCWDNDTSHSEFYDLSIKNNNPAIGNYAFVINDEKVIPTASAIEILRGKQFVLKINATDREESLSTVLLTITANDPLSGNSLFFGDYANKPLNNLGSNYTLNITFPLTTNTGIAVLNIRLFENGTSYEDTRTQKFKIQNNIPVLSSMSLNGLTETKIEISEGDWINFTFSVSDAENSIAYLQVYIQNFETQLFVNYTVNYEGTSTVLKIRAYDLGVGSFAAYGYVIDSEGDQDRFDTAIIFDIVPIKVFTPTLWLMFTVGIVLGGIASFIISSILFKRITSLGETTTPQERKKVRKIKSKKLESEEEEIEPEEESEEEPEEAQPPIEDEEQGEKKKKFVRKL